MAETEPVAPVPAAPVEIPAVHCVDSPPPPLPILPIPACDVLPCPPLTDDEVAAIESYMRRASRWMADVYDCAVPTAP